MVDEQEVELVEIIETSNDDSLIGRFLMDAVYEHCTSNEHMQQFMIQLMANMALNKLVCPHCIVTGLKSVYDQTFDVTVNNDGGHDVKLKLEEELAAMEGNETTH